MLKRCLTWVGLAALACACGSDSSSGAAAASVPLTDIPPKVASALCTAYENCYGPVWSIFFAGSNCAAVTEARIRNGTFPQFQGRIDAGTIHYDPTLAPACLDALRARTCAQLLDRDSPECLAALDGTVALGGACDLNEECRGQARCESSTGTCPGQCAPLLVSGQTCAQDSDCQSGLQCFTETKACVAPAASGEPCEYGAPPCGPGLFCAGKNDTNRTSGTCKSPTQVFGAALNAACDPSVGQLCQVGLSCVADSYTTAVVWKCLQGGTYAAGAACKLGYPDACTDGSYCLTGTSGIAMLSGTCTTLPSDGAACSTASGKQCQPSAACVGGTCHNLAANGVSCTGDAMCYAENCTANVCQSRLPCQ
jgi:hypothetical protein